MTSESCWNPSWKTRAHRHRARYLLHFFVAERCFVEAVQFACPRMSAAWGRWDIARLTRIAMTGTCARSPLPQRWQSLYDSAIATGGALRLRVWRTLCSPADFASCWRAPRLFGRIPSSIKPLSLWGVASCSFSAPWLQCRVGRASSCGQRKMSGAVCTPLLPLGSVVGPRPRAELRLCRFPETKKSGPSWPADARSGGL